MTVLQLFKSIDPDVFVEEYAKYEGLCEQVMFDKDVPLENKGSVFSELMKNTKELFIRIRDEEIPKKNKRESIVFSVPVEDSSLLNSFLVHKEDLDNYIEEGNLPETYAYEFEDVRNILDYTVSEACRHIIDDDIRIAMSIFYEITFFGYSMDKRDDKIQSIGYELEEALKEIKAGNIIKYSSAEDVFSNLGVRDKRTDFEKTFDKEKAHVKNEYWKQVKSILYALEKYYFGLGRYYE